MKAYPTVATQPNRKIRKSQRGAIFAENRQDTKTRRATRREKRNAEGN